MLSYDGCIQILQTTRGEGRCWLAAETAAHSKRETEERLRMEVQWLEALGKAGQSLQLMAWVLNWSKGGGLVATKKVLPLCLFQGLIKCA